MIKEFALEPEAIVTSYRDFSYFIEKFGVAKGQVISRFPKRWRRDVIEAAGRTLRWADRQRIEERLRRCGEDVIFPTGRPGGEPSQPWIERAVEEHRRLPFSGIIAVRKPTGEADVYEAAELDEDTSIFAGESSFPIERTAEGIVDCFALLVKYAAVIKLIDPYLTAGRASYRRPLGLIFELIGDRQATVEIHGSDYFSDAELKRHFEDFLPSVRKPEVTVKLYAHPLADMHNRFVLTERGGVMFGAGLSDDEDSRLPAEDDVTLMTEALRAQRWAQYPSDGELCTWSD